MFKDKKRKKLQGVINLLIDNSNLYKKHFNYGRKNHKFGKL